MERVEGLPSMATFIGQALHPTVRTCDAVASRLEQLRTQAAHTADLLRTSLNVQQQADSHESLEQIQNNAKLFQINAKIIPKQCRHNSKIMSK